MEGLGRVGRLRAGGAARWWRSQQRGRGVVRHGCLCRARRGAGCRVGLKVKIFKLFFFFFFPQEFTFYIFYRKDRLFHHFYPEKDTIYSNFLYRNLVKNLKLFSKIKF